jgi:hypothetical protein
MPPTPQQRSQFLAALTLGCEVEVAAELVSLPFAELQAERRRDPAFDAEIRSRIAHVELHHLRNLHSAAKETRHWRVSTWWLERRIPERYAPPSRTGVRESEQKMLALAELIAQNVSDEATRAELLEELSRLAEESDEPVAPNVTKEPTAV